MKTIAPKPLPDMPGNGFHINMSLKPPFDDALFSHMIAGILSCARDMTLFMNPLENSYLRLGKCKAPGYVSWSKENRSQLVRIPAASGEFRRAELRSPDPCANPYLAFSLMIYAALYGIEQKLTLCPAADINLFTADPETLLSYEKLPQSLSDAREAAVSSDFIKTHIPAQILNIYLKK